MYYHALKDVGINTEEPPILGSPGTPLSYDARRGCTQKYAPLPHMSYHVKYLRQKVNA